MRVGATGVGEVAMHLTVELRNVYRIRPEESCKRKQSIM